MHPIEIVIPVTMIAVPVYWGYLVLRRLGENTAEIRHIADELAKQRTGQETTSMGE